MSYVKQRTTAEQRLAARMIWSCTSRETHSAEFLAVLFDLSRPTIMELCSDLPRLGDKYRDPETLRPLWVTDRQRKALPVTDQDWIRAKAEAYAHIGHRVAASSDACVALIQRTAA